MVRYVAHHRLTSAKRYALGKVYRKSLPGSAPRELWECDFDIVGYFNNFTFYYSCFSYLIQGHHNTE